MSKEVTQYAIDTQDMPALAYLLSVGSTCRSHIAEHLGIKIDIADTVTRRLAKQKYIDGTARSFGATNVLYFYCTDLGRRALRQWQDARASALVPPRRPNVFEGVYQPTSSRAYYRNDGHSHIASRGVGC